MRLDGGWGVAARRCVSQAGRRTRSMWSELRHDQPEICIFRSFEAG
jgi:hypothetical protein